MRVGRSVYAAQKKFRLWPHRLTICGPGRQQMFHWLWWVWEV